jgi:hypothetical protein
MHHAGAEFVVKGRSVVALTKFVCCIPRGDAADASFASLGFGVGKGRLGRLSLFWRKRRQFSRDFSG